MDCEDCRGPVIQHILDATCIIDGTFVTLKLIRKSRHLYKIEIGQLFSTEPLASDPDNHCVPIYDVLHVPDDEDQAVIVMPLLRPFTDPCFDTCGEVVECFRQLFVGLQFIHKQHVAHCDCMDLNIMMDATCLFFHPFHPQDIDMRRDYKGEAKSLTHTQCPPKYFYIDFGISCCYDANNTAPLEEPIWGGNKTVPKFQNLDQPRNPFLTDVYYLGNMIRNEFLLTKHRFEFMAPLVGDMVQEDLTKRPTMDEVITRFDEILKQLSSWKLQSRVVDKEDGNIIGLYSLDPPYRLYCQERTGFLASV
ncbi:hypothetical protein SERLA73DRAFT_125647 [Serpula lacrymans var. lacrymans S7.3]|uniref:Protein kinase domain-containing protein n=1 Tax=Serpula lacrymans var. lacrymans (strain S7.3) TaxID=936435 RepID=F8QAE5_SERL3|nr:hypothetical protein SERLA73DRAFT_125647 [Serpula lacrymans var. lacrymans S7.3]